MNRSDTKRQILPLLLLRYREPCFFNHLGKSRLRWESFDRFDEVLVGISIRGEDVTERRNDVERVE